MKLPANELDRSDPGDDVALRFQYQYCYAAINAVRLVTHQHEITALICENYEDLLIERADGRYVASQVKTRDLDQPLFRASDNQVRRALGRFCRLEARFPGQFEVYEFITNHAFAESKQDHTNLPWILSALRDRGTVSRLPSSNPIRRIVEDVAQECDCGVDQALRALTRTHLQCRRDSIRSISADLISAVADCQDLADRAYAVVVQIATMLRSLAAEASAKRLAGTVTDRYAPGIDLKRVMDDHLLAGKRIDRGEVERIFQVHVGAPQGFETLNVAGLIPPNELPRGLERMILKMARGGVQASRIEEMQDLVYALQALYLRWTQRHGTEQANSRYEDLLARVRHDCVEAVTLAEGAGEPYGPVMYGELVERVRTRCHEEVPTLYGCRPEHLLGAAGALTENCKTWWSRKFELGVG